MKKLFERAVAAARANPFKSFVWVVLGVLVFAVGISLGDPLGRELYLLTQ